MLALKKAESRLTMLVLQIDAAASRNIALAGNQKRKLYLSYSIVVIYRHKNAEMFSYTSNTALVRTHLSVKIENFGSGYLECPVSTVIVEHK